jgi:hypothetical protein
MWDLQILLKVGKKARAGREGMSRGRERGEGEKVEGDKEEEVEEEQEDGQGAGEAARARAMLKEGSRAEWKVSNLRQRSTTISACQ